MAATYRSASSGTNFTTSGAKTCPTPAGIQLGDFLVGQMILYGTGVVTAYDAAYPQIGSFNEVDVNNQGVFGGVWNGTAPVVTVTIQASTGGNVAALAVQGGGAALELDGASLQSIDAAYSASQTTQTFTPSKDGCCIVSVIAGTAQVYSSVTYGGSFTERLENENYGLNSFATYDQAVAAGAAATVSWSPGSPAAMTILAIREAAVAAQALQFERPNLTILGLRRR